MCTITDTHVSADMTDVMLDLSHKFQSPLGTLIPNFWISYPVGLADCLTLKWAQSMKIVYSTLDFS